MLGSFKFSNSRAQMSAPFELLVAVIIMSFVIVVGMQALDQLKIEQCRGQVGKSLQDMKLALESAEKFRAPQRFSFSPPSCYKNERIVLEVINQQNTCSRLCGGNRRTCTVLNYFVEGPISERVCVDISPTTLFFDDQTAPEVCPPFTGAYQVINPKEPNAPNGSIPHGYYQILNQSRGQAFSEICMFRRT